MKPEGPFAIPMAWLGGAHLAHVVSVEDKENLSRVQVTIIAPDADDKARLWARVAVPFAGDNYGAFFIPDVGEEVLVVFLGGDPRFPVVIGSLWNGKTGIPEQIGGKSVDRWTLTGRAGTRIAIVEEESGQEKVEIETPGGVTATLTDAQGGSITFEAAGNTLTMDTQGVSIQTGGKFSVDASQINMSAGQTKVDSAMATFTNTVKCETLILTTTVSSTYTPGAGNIW